LTRGSGLDGFTGIPEINGNIVRPFLKFSREEVLHFAKENNISWREDQSNTSTKYVRNKIRHKVLPVLKEINPSLLETFSKTLENLQESKQLVADRIEAISKDSMQPLEASKDANSFTINIKKIQRLSNPKAYLFQLLKAYHFTEFKDIYKLLSAQSGKQVFSKTHVLLKDRDFLILSQRAAASDISQAQENTFQIAENTVEIKHPIHLTFAEVTTTSLPTKNTIYVSKSHLKFPLIVRKWQNGDYFYPLGMQGKKKISKYFKDEKLSLLEKNNTWLLCNNNGLIIWVINRRQDNRFEVKSDSEMTKICLT
jgi:tRNA(Ile)-lysidine synthase